MKIAIIADTHIGARNDSETLLGCQKKFFDKIFFPTILSQGIDTVIDLGDTFDRRKFVNFKTLDMSRKFLFDPLQKHGIDTHILVGNHTTFYKNTNRINSPALLLREYRNIKVYEEAERVVFDRLAVAMVPWINDENHKPTLEFIEKDDSLLCMGHFEFAGFQTLKGVVHEEGLDANLFKKYQKVLSGHFHYKQDNGHVFYLGCPYEMIWSSAPEEKGFHILDTETLDLEFIPNPYTLFKRIRYDDGCDTDLSTLHGCYVRVYVNKKTDSYAFDVFMDQVFAAQPVHVTVIDDIQMTSGGTQDIKFDGSSDTLNLLNGYIEKMDGIPDKEKLKKTASQIYSEAITTQDK